MSKIISKLIIVTVLLFILAACSPSVASDPTISPEEVQTNIARSVTETLRFFTPNPTETPLPSLTPTASQTPTPLPAMVSVSENTICREGPDKNFRELGSIQVGESSLVLAKDIDGLYWFITNPTITDGACWITNQFATVSGDTSILPVFTSIPTITPTLGPDFEIYLEKMSKCGDETWLNFRVINTGNQSFASWQLIGKDTVTGEIRTRKDYAFWDWADCSHLFHYSFELEPGQNRAGAMLYGLNWDVTGHEIILDAKFCSERELQGICVTRTLFFTP